MFSIQACMLHNKGYKKLFLWNAIWLIKSWYLYLGKPNGILTCFHDFPFKQSKAFPFIFQIMKSVVSFKEPTINTLMLWEAVYLPSFLLLKKGTKSPVTIRSL